MKQRNPQIRERCAFVRPMFYYFVSIIQLGIKATYCINYAELFSYVTQYKEKIKRINTSWPRSKMQTFWVHFCYVVFQHFISVHLGNTFLH